MQTTWSLLRQKDVPDRDPEPDADATTDAGTSGRRLACAACGQPVTTEGERTSVAGGHEHVRENPHGYSFRFGCFRQAPGCEPDGPASSFYTWFPGFAWQIANCRACRTHLGWHFLGDASQFFGLILDRLVPVEESEGSAPTH